jgi:hypothetical protein
MTMSLLFSIGVRGRSWSVNAVLGRKALSKLTNELPLGRRAQQEANVSTRRRSGERTECSLSDIEGLSAEIENLGSLWT